MIEPFQFLEAQQDELAGIVEPMDAATLLDESRCPGWSIADVLLHLGQTNEIAVASLTGRFEEAAAPMTDPTPDAENVDDWAALAVARDRPDDPADSRARWLTSANAQIEAFSNIDPHEKVQWVVGLMAARSLGATRLSETYIHSRDIADAIGVELVGGDRLKPIARLAWRTIPYAFERAGLPRPAPVAVELLAPDGTSWKFAPDAEAPNFVKGTAADFCEVAAQRADASDTSLEASGPDAENILRLVRTFA